MKIFKNRVILYTLLIGIFFPLTSIFLVYQKSSRLQEVQNHIEDLNFQAIVVENKQATNRAVLQNFADADRFYIDKHIESITLLEPEVVALQKITKQRTFMDDPEVTRRLETLLNDNTLVFSEGVVQSYDFFKETVETLVRPVEINLDNLQEILAKIEGIPIGNYMPGPNRPQLIITDLKLDRKTLANENEIFQLNIKLLKREYTNVP